MTEGGEADVRVDGQRTVHAIAQGEITLLYTSNAAVVRSYLRRRLASPELVDDVLADVFEQAIRSNHSYDSSRGTRRQWLLGIARHRVRHLWRDRARAHGLFGRISGLDQQATTGDDFERIDDVLAGDLLLRELRHLPVIYSEALLHRVVLARDYRETAKALGCSESTVRVRVHRGLRLLRDRMKTR